MIGPAARTNCKIKSQQINQLSKIDSEEASWFQKQILMTGRIQLQGFIFNLQKIEKILTFSKVV